MILSIIIPTYNELNNIERLVKEINKQVPKSTIFIIDDSKEDDIGKLIYDTFFWTLKSQSVKLTIIFISISSKNDGCFKSSIEPIHNPDNISVGILFKYK